MSIGFTPFYTPRWVCFWSLRRAAPWPNRPLRPKPTAAARELPSGGLLWHGRMAGCDLGRLAGAAAQNARGTPAVNWCTLIYSLSLVDRLGSTWRFDCSFFGGQTESRHAWVTHIFLRASKQSGQQASTCEKDQRTSPGHLPTVSSLVGEEAACTSDPPNDVRCVFSCDIPKTQEERLLHHTGCV